MVDCDLVYIGSSNVHQSANIESCGVNIRYMEDNYISGYSNS